MEYLATEIVKHVYVSTMRMVPYKIIDNLPGLYKDFIWNGKLSKMKNSTLILSEF